MATYADLIEQITGGGPLTQEEYERILEKAEILVYGNESDLFTKLDYIQSSGTQYINSKYIGSNNTKIELTFTALGAGTSNSIIGARDDYRSNAIDLTYYNGGWYVYGDIEGELSVDFVNNTKYDVIIDNNTIYCKLATDTEYTIVKTFTEKSFTTRPIFVFAENWKGTAGSLASLRLHVLKIYNGDNLVANFLPVKRKSDDEVCLYDKVTHQFLVNSGTGTFTAGPTI